MIALRQGTAGAVAAAFLLAGMGVAQAKIEQLHASLQPPTGISSDGSGMMTGKYNTATRFVSWNVTYKKLSSKVIMAHFHGPVSSPGESGPIQVWLTKKPEHPRSHSPITGRAKITPEQAKELLGGHWYVNVHTQKNPGGEIRGVVHTGG